MSFGGVAATGTFLGSCTRSSCSRLGALRRRCLSGQAADATISSTNALTCVSNLNSASNGPLQDITIAVKDNICTVSMHTTCSSAMLSKFASPFDATVVKAIKDAGAKIIGKTNCDEFGMGSLNIHSVHGPVINPHQLPTSTVPWSDRERRSAGGSSGGSAAAVAAGLCDAALSTDTGGSTRLPASYCGIVGLKPSYGLISRWGVVSFADSLDCVGVMGKTVDVVQRVFKTLSFHDHRDPTAATLDTRQKALTACSLAMRRWSSCKTSISGLRIGIPKEYFPHELDPAIYRPIRRILKSLQKLGASLIPVSLPSTSYALSAYYVIASAEASSNMARYDGVQYGLYVAPPPGCDLTKTANIYAHSRSRGFGSEVKKRILLGTYALTAEQVLHAFDNYFLQAQRVRRLVTRDFDRVFAIPNVLSSSPPLPNSISSDRVDILIHPSAIRTAPSLSEPVSGLQSYVQDVLTVPASLAGLPALNVPAGLAEDGWPVGLSIVGQWACDEMVLQVGQMIEQLDLEI